MNYSGNKDSKVICVAWYRKDQWKRLCDISEDKLEYTYEEWKKTAKTQIKLLKKEGIRVEKVDFDIDEFVDWCIDKKYSINSKARADFAIYKNNLDNALADSE